MAEVVQSHVEEMLPEVYELQQLGILTPSEAKSVIKTRTDFEYKMRRRISKKFDFVRFIDFELKLEKLKQARILKFGVNDISEGARYKSVQRIHFIFQKCLLKYKNDIQLWLRYINYCKQVSSSRALGLAFVQALKHNPTNDSLWIMSAKNEMEGNKNVSAARRIFHQGLKFNNDSAKLWIEYFRLEILHVEKLYKRQVFLQGCDNATSTSLSSEFMTFQTAKIVFKNALSKISFTAETLNDFIKVTENVQNAESLVQFIYTTALKENPQNPSMWVCVANFILSKNNDHKKCVSILETALKIINNADCMFEVVQFVFDHVDKLENHEEVINSVLEHLPLIVSCGTNSVIKLADILSKNGIIEPCRGLVESSLKEAPLDKELWLYKVRNFSLDVNADIQEAVTLLPDDKEILLEYLTNLLLSDSYETCKEKWKSAIMKPSGSSIMVHFLELVYSNEGIDETRQEYSRFQSVHAVTEPVITKMIALECTEENYSAALNLYETLCSHFSTMDNWKMLIGFCDKHVPQKLSNIIWKSKKLFKESDLEL